MRNNAVLCVFIHLLLLVTLSYTVLSPVAFAAQENTLESRASCTQQTSQPPPSSQSYRESGDNEDLTTPPSTEVPTPITLGLFIEEIPAINELENTFTIEGRMSITWCDLRLQHGGSGEENIDTFLEEKAQEKIRSIWWPDITFANEVAKRDIANEALFIHGNGTVEYREKFSVTLEGKYDLSKFPFDKQTLQIEMASFAWDVRYLKILIDTQRTGFSDEFELPEWHTSQITNDIKEFMEVESPAPFSKLVIMIDVTRQFGFYLWKVLLPLISLVLICFAIFWMSNDSLADRMSISFTGVLTVVAYQFIATGSLPKVPYITLMDVYINFSFIIMIATILQSIVISSYQNSDKNERARHIDKSSRWLFPIAYFGGLGVLTLVFTTMQ